MTTIMSPSETETISRGQISKLYELLEHALLKTGLPKEASQQVIEAQGAEMVKVFVADFRKRVEANSEMIVRPFKLDRTKTREQMIKALGRAEYVNTDVLATMPTDGPDEGEIYFFPAKHYVPVAEQATELAKRGLVPHYLAQMQVNIDDPSFADDHPNGMQWDKNSYAAFDRWSGERKVDVNRDDNDWDDDCWFAGVRK